MITELADAGQTHPVTIDGDIIKTTDGFEATVVSVNDDESIDLAVERGECSVDLNVSGDLRTWIIDGHKFTLPAKRQHVCSSADCGPCAGCPSD